MYHGEDSKPLTAKEKAIRHWRLHHGLSEREALVWWKESEEMREWTTDWENRNSRSVEAAVTRFMEKAPQGSSRKELDEMQRQQREIELEASAKRFIDERGAFKREQVARRAFTGRAW